MGASARKPEAGHGEVMIEGERDSQSGAFHDHETRRVDRRKLVKVGTPKIVPRLLQIPQIARKQFYNAGSSDGFFPDERHVAVGVAVEKREGFDDDGN